jgi:hypothetical protein
VQRAYSTLCLRLLPSEFENLLWYICSCEHRAPRVKHIDVSPRWSARADFKPRLQHGAGTKQMKVEEVDGSSQESKEHEKPRMTRRTPARIGAHKPALRMDPPQNRRSFSWTTLLPSSHIPARLPQCATEILLVSQCNHRVYLRGTASWGVRR